MEVMHPAQRLSWLMMLQRILRISATEYWPSPHGHFPCADSTRLHLKASHAILLLQGLDEEPRAQPLALSLVPFDAGGGSFGAAGGLHRGLRRNSFGSATLGCARKAQRFSPQELAAQRWLESLAVRCPSICRRCTPADSSSA